MGNVWVRAAAAAVVSFIVCGAAMAQSIDLRVSGISDSPNDITLGQGNVTYTVTVYNNSSSVATNVVLTNTLPSGAAYVSSSSATGTCTPSDASHVICTWSSLNAFNSVTASVTVTPGTGGTNTFTASVAGDQTDPTPSNNTLSETTTVNATIDLQVNGISDSPNDITLGQGNITYTVSTYNASSSKATNAVLTINLPTSSTFVSTSSASWACAQTSASVVTCTLATYNAFTSLNATVTVTPGAGGTNTLTAGIAADQGDHAPSNNSRSEASTVNATIDLQVNGISDSPNDITLGQGNITYTVSTYNASSSKATNAVLTINLPASSTFVSTSSASWACAQTSASVVTCTLATYNAFTSLNATVTVTPGAGGTNTLTAGIAADQGDHAPSNNSRSEASTVNATIDLQVNGISDSPNDITLGQGNITYTVNTYNATSSKATNAVLTINLPASSSFVSTTSSTYACAQTSASVVTCTLATYNAFNSLSASVTVTPGAAGTNTLTASIAADQGDHVPANNSASESSTVNGTIDLQISGIGDSPGDITLGQGNVTYTINTYNATSSKATNAVLTINLPASSAFVSATSTSYACSQTSASVVTCTLATFNAFNSLSASVTVTPGAGGTNTLTASIAADQGDHAPANNSGSESTTVNATIDLQLSGIGDSPNDITLGQGNVTYTVNTYNATSSKATNAVLTINLPASSTFVGTTSSSYTCSQTSASVVTCTLATFNAFNSLSANVTVTPGAGGTNTLTASIAADQGDHAPANNSDSETTTVNATIDLAVSSIGDNPNDITLGQGNVTYTVNTYNYTTSKATNTVLTINLPASSTYVSASATLSGTCSQSSPGVVTCNWATHNAFNTGTVTLVVTPGAGGTNTLSASYSSSDQSDHVPANNSDSETTTVNATIDLAVTGISDNPADITLGQGNVTYSVNIYNYTSSKATNTVLTANLPASSTFVSASATLSGTCSQSSPGVVTCNWATHNAFNSGTVTIVVTPGAGGANTISASYSSSVQGDHVPANNSASESTTVNATIDLAVSGISDNPNDVTLGQGNVTYTISTYNYTTSKATNTVLTVNLPASSSFVSASTTLSGTCSQSSPGVVTCNWATHNAFNSATTTIVVTPGAGGTNTLTASYASSVQGDHNNTNNSDSETTTVNATLDLQLTMSDTPDPRTLATGNVTYTINVYNNTTSKATNPLIAVSLDPSTTFVSATPGTGGTCPTTGATVQCTWTDIAAFNTRTLTVVVTPTAAQQISATASVSADQGDHDPGDNSETETTNINPGSAPTITGFSPTSGPAGTVVTITGSSFFSSTSVKFNGLSATFTVNNNGSITATVPNGATDGPIAITNSVGTTTSGSSFDVTPAPDLTISKTASAATTPTGSSFDYNIAVGNSGAGTAGDVTVVDTLPAGVTLNSISATGWSCSGTTTVTCTMGALASLANAAVITLNVTAPATGTTVVNTATVSTTTPEPNTGNNSSSVSVGVVGCPTTPAITAPANVCAGTTGHTASIDPVPGATYAWTITAGNGTITSGAGSNLITFSAGTASPLTLSVSVTVTSCPTVTNSFSVNVSTPTATITPSGPTTFCDGGSVTLAANNGASWLWSTGATTQSITVSAGGSYTVAVTDAAGCTATSAPTNVVVNPAPAATITPSGPTSFCTGGSVTLTASNGASWLWSTGATSQSITVNASGSYFVTVTDGNGCSATSSPEVVSVYTTPDTTVTASGPTTFCTGGSVTLTAPDGMATYAWSNGGNTQSITVTNSGTFTVTVTDASGCTGTSAPVNVTVNPAPTATITPSGPTTFCDGGNVTLTASAGVSWLWSNGATTQSITTGTAGSYTVTVTDANGCSATSPPTTVTVTPAPNATITPSGPTTFCTGGSVTLTAPAGMSNYTWSTGATSQSILVGSTGTFTVTVTDASGCTATSAPVNVTVKPLPNATITPSGPLTFCEGGSVTLTAPAGMAGYSWSNGAASPSITVNSAGSYFVTITDSGGCTATSSPANVVVNQAAPASITASGPTTFCQGGSVTLTASSGAGWLWSNGATTQSITVGTAGNYSVAVTDPGNGCTATSSPVTVVVNPTPLVVITGPNQTCPGTTVTLDAGPNFASYNWSNGETTQQINVTPSAATTYSVTVTDANGCPATASHTVSLSATPAATITAPASVCATTTGHTASVAPQSGATYAWTITGGTFSSATGGSTVTFNAGPSGNVTLGVTVTAGSCTSTGSATIPIDPNPVAAVTAPSAVCALSTGHTASVPSQPGATYAWTITGGTFTGATNGNSVTFDAGSGAGITLGVTVTLGSCTSTGSTTVTINPAPVATITAPAAVCPSSANTASVPSQPGASYAWTITGGAFTSATSGATVTFTAGTSGSVALGVTVTLGSCTSTGSATMPINATPAPAITAPASVCASSTGHTASVPPQPGATYAWTITGGTFSGATTGPSVTFDAGTGSSITLGVTVTSGSCTSTGSTTVTVHPAPLATITAPAAVCPLSTGHTASVPSQPGATYAWTISGGTFTSATNGNSVTFNAGSGSGLTLAVTVTSGSCTSTGSTTVTINPAPVATITAPAAVCPSSANTASVPSQPGATYAWTITGGAITGAANGNTVAFTAGASGSVALGVTVTLGSCTSTGSATMPINPSPAATITTPAAVCASSAGHSASVAPQPGATYAWTITGGTFSGSTDGPNVTFDAGTGSSLTLGVTVTTGSCTSTGSTTVAVNPLPSPVITAPANVDANTAGHAASVVPEAGTTYAWSITNGTITGGANTPSITFSAGATGPITLAVTATRSGCIATTSTVVAVNTQANEADLAITKSAPATVPAGAQFTYTLEVTNGGPAVSLNASVTDVLPAGLTLIGVDGGSWSCSTSGNAVTCSASPAAGSSSTIAITVQAPSQAGTLTNTAGVNANITPDPNPSNNTGSASTTVIVQTPVCPNVPPSLSAPADGAAVTSPVTLSWTGVTGALSYDVWITTNGTASIAGNTTATSLTKAVEAGTSSWFVVANLPGGCTALTSGTRTFTVAPSNTCGSNGKPTLVSPTGGPLSSPVAFAWTAVPNAIGYRLWIEVDGTAAQDIGATDGALSLTANVPPGAIVAYVDALFSGCPPTRSNGVAFDIPAPDPCAGRSAVTLIAPADDALVNSSSVELQWSAAAKSNGYRVWASVDGGPAEVVEETGDTSARVTFEKGEVIWFVETLYNGCASTRSQSFRFVIPARNECGTARPDLLSPANDTTVTDAGVTFAWNGVPDALQYELWLGLDDGTPTLIGTTPAGTTSLTHTVPPGKLSWFVRALVDRCPSRDSRSATFTFTPPPSCETNRRPLAVAPLDGAQVTAPVDFDWSDVGATRYELWISHGNAAPSKVADTTATGANGIPLANGNHRWFVRAFFAQGCAPRDTVEQQLVVVPTPAACAPLGAPLVSAPGQISSGVEFLIQWTPIAGATSYQLQLASDESFSDAGTITTTATQHAYTATAAGSPSTTYARVRAIDARCTPAPNVGAFGPGSAIFVLPATVSEGSAPLGTSTLSYSLPLGPELAGQTFTAVPSQPWLSVAPASGVVPPGGITLTVTADTAGLPPGTSLGGVTVTLSTPSSRIRTSGTTTVTTPFTVNLVTPVTPAPKNTPPPDALIIPAVANADGFNSHFQSDVRVSNTSAQVMKYQLTFIPTGESGISAGRQTTFSIEPGRTVALDDILETWFGTGGTNAVGALEVRPLTEVARSTSSAALGALANIATFASSRTFNVTPNGTFGQYIPAIPFARFIDRSSVISLQQIAQSARHRTNLGLVEGSGDSASLLVKVFSSTGIKLTEFPVNLNGGQHTQLNSFLTQHGITTLDDGRVEVQVVGGNGKVTAYASVIDNATADPLLVSPVTLGAAGNTKWVVPGVADISNGIANWQTDVRIFNAGTEPSVVTLSFHSQNGGEPKSTTISLAPGEVRQLDRAVASLFGVTQDGGALHIATSAAARLIATARTYNQTTQGTYGQFISAVTPAESVAVGSRPLQLLQIEESDRYRSNIGFAEVTGKPVTLEVSIIPPDAKFTATVEIKLAANEFRQINSMLDGLGIGDIHNARISVRAVAGEGRATTYASVIDAQTNDPTFVPAQ